MGVRGVSQNEKVGLTWFLNRNRRIGGFLKELDLAKGVTQG